MAKIGNQNVKVLRNYYNAASRILVELNRKMKVNGKIAYFVVVTDTNTGYHTTINEFDGIQKAWQNFMVASGLNLEYTI